MSIYENLDEFDGRPVVDFAKGDNLQAADSVAYRIRLDYDMFEQGLRLDDLLAEFLQLPNLDRVSHLVIGIWDFESSVDSASIIEALASNRQRLSGLRALFFGDIISEETEISWIQQSDVSPLFLSFPQLEILRVRGATGLSVGSIRHANLRHLAFESGGLPREVIEAVLRADLPRLEHLELWLGTENYGFTGTAEMFSGFLRETRFPHLRYLGLKNAEIQDQIAEMVAQAPLLAQIEVLDLSMGILTDAGVDALLASPYLRRLKKLDIHHHFVSNEKVAKLEATGIVVDASRQQKAEESDGEVYRFTAVSE